MNTDMRSVRLASIGCQMLGWVLESAKNAVVQGLSSGSFHPVVRTSRRVGKYPWLVCRTCAPGLGEFLGEGNFDLWIADGVDPGEDTRRIFFSLR